MALRGIFGFDLYDLYPELSSIVKVFIMIVTVLALPTVKARQGTLDHIPETKRIGAPGVYRKDVLKQLILSKNGKFEEKKRAGKDARIEKKKEERNGRDRKKRKIKKALRCGSTESEESSPSGDSEVEAACFEEGNYHLNEQQLQQNPKGKEAGV